MVVYTQSRYHYPSSNYSNYSGHIPQKLWDPANLLQIGNPDRGGNLTCTSFAPSKGRRCWNPINRGNRSDAWRVIDDLSATDPSGPGAFHLLQELAAYTVCIRDHQDQAHSVARKWERIIRAAYPPNHGSSTSCQKQRVSNLFGSRASAGVKAEGRDAKDRSFAEQPYKEAKAREEAAKREKARKDEAERAAAKNRQDLEELKERMRRLEELEEKFRQAEEAARRAKARKEAEEAAAKKRREQEELTERMRRRAEKLRKDREEQERQRAELEKQKWSEAWARYLKGWEDFESECLTCIRSTAR